MRSPDEALQSGPFRFETPYVLGGRICLFGDRIQLSGYTPLRRYRKTIPLDQLVHVDAPDDDRLLLWTTGGEVLRIRVKSSRNWRDMLRAHATAIQTRQVES